MNRFERLFFILERNPEDAWSGNKEVRGVVKIILTAEQIRVMWEISGLPVEKDCQYAIGIFLRQGGSQRLQPKFFSFQPNAHGNIRTETMLPYKLQEGETVFGVGLSIIDKKEDAKRRFPLIAFQNMRGPWHSMLQALVAEEASKKTEVPQQSPQATKPQQQQQKQRQQQQTQQQPQQQPQQVSLSREARFRKHFTGCDPFGTTNPSYRWWRNTDMHRLNQFLAEMDLTLPLELNKDGYLACGLFGHVLLGLYTDNTLHREFFILGIPAKSKEDTGNYYSHSRWESLGKQTVPEQEETGYWLTYIDCDTSRVVKVV